MRQFRIILSFELKNYFKNKTFVISTVVMILLMAAVILFPGIKGMFSLGSGIKGSGHRPVMLVASGLPGMSEAFAGAFENYRVKSADRDVDWIKKQIRDKRAECAFVIDDMGSYTYYVGDLSMYDMNRDVADKIIADAYKIHALAEKGIPAEEAENILSYQVRSETEKLGQDQMHNFFYTYIMIFALYMMIILYGQMVATNVASEKGSRAMELLITSAKPVNMMFGKVIASCVAGLAQITAVFGSALLLFKFAGKGWRDNMIVRSLFDIPPGLLAYMLLFFVLGFFLYGFIYGAVSSTVSKVEDLHALITPVTLIFMAAFILVIFSMSSGSVDNGAMKVCSFVPFTSSMAMFARIAMGSVPAYQVLLSVGILALSVIAIGALAARIYKAGVLLYGTRPGFKTVIRALRHAG